MTEDLLEDRLTGAMGARAQAAAPAAPDFADVTARSGRHRRARAARAVGASALVLVLLVGAVVVAATRRDGGVDVATTPNPAPAAVPVDPVVRWPTLIGADPTLADVAVTTDAGVQPFADAGDIDITPYVVLGYPKAEHMVIYGLDGGRWRTTTSWIQHADQASGTIRLLAGTGFDPARLDRVPRSTSFYVGSEQDSATVGASSYANARPDVLLASPERQRLDLPVERIGGLDWVVIPDACVPGPVACERTAVGGDQAHLVVVELQTTPGFDLRSALGRVELRSEAELVRPPGVLAVVPAGSESPPYQKPTPWKAAPFLLVQEPAGAEGWAWPVEVSPGYSAAYSLWAHYGKSMPETASSPGWIRWVEGLDALAPPEVGDAWAVLGAEQAAGHDPTTTEPGLSALRAVVADGATRCPS